MVNHHWSMVNHPLGRCRIAASRHKGTLMNVNIAVRVILLPLLVGAAAFAPPVTTLPIKHIVVLGDSLSDQGNLLAATSVISPIAVPDPTHYFAGRFSNGENYAGVLADKLG